MYCSPELLHFTYMRATLKLLILSQIHTYTW